jgi:hypothetical protein
MQSNNITYIVQMNFSNYNDQFMHEIIQHLLLKNPLN